MIAPCKKGMPRFAPARSTASIASMRAPLHSDRVDGRRIRVGFVSALLRENTVGQYFSRWLSDLNRNDFEVCFYPLGGNDDKVTKAIHGRADRVRPFLGGDATPSTIVPVIRDEHLDILIYPEMGMDQVTFALAGMRLAPRQCVAWGHPVTTGHSTIDHFLSCDVMEPPNSAAHYSEPLTRLPGIGTRFARPELPPVADRATFSLPTDATLLLCPQSLFKIHPDNDVAVRTIACGEPFSGFGTLRRQTSGDHRPLHAPAFGAIRWLRNRDPSANARPAAPFPRGLSRSESRLRRDAGHIALVGGTDQRRRTRLRVAGGNASWRNDARAAECRDASDDRGGRADRCRPRRLCAHRFAPVRRPRVARSSLSADPGKQRTPFR